MEGLSSIFQNFAEVFNPLISFIVWAFPFKIYTLHDGECGVILTLGKVRRKKAEKTPGVVICFAFEELEHCQGINEYIDCDAQNIQTKDGRVMIVNSALTYDIINYQKAMIENDDIEFVISGVALNEMREYARARELSEIIDSEKLTSGLSGKINRKLKKHGVRIVSLMITDLRPHDMTMLCDSLREIFTGKAISIR